MKTLLAVCIPTFNRAEQLDRQLGWLAEEIVGFEADCEIIISDNCSDDQTSDIIYKWKVKLPNISYKTNRNANNLGWMRNFLYCLNTSSSEYTWIIGDDDEIEKGALAVVMQALKADSNLALMYLNFSGRDKGTGKIVGEYWFDLNLDQNTTNGAAIFQHCIEKNIGSVIFVTAAIYRTQLALAAISKWPKSVDNWAGLGFWTGFCATQGNVLVTSKTYMECTMGSSYWQKDPKMWFGIRYGDITQLYAKLQEIGYPSKFCNRCITRLLTEDIFDKNRLSIFKYYLWCFATNPLWAFSILTAFVKAWFSTKFPRNKTTPAIASS
jgi:abequosyltransferase